MPQSLSCVNLHIIFSTKHRLNIISDRNRNSLQAYIATIIRNKGAHCYRVGGTGDHVHIACTLPRTMNQSELVRVVKCESSKWFRETNDPEFGWQHGFGCFSVSSSHLSQLVGYIDNQVVHHHNKTFQEEYLEFLEKYQVDFDERYVWD